MMTYEQYLLEIVKERASNPQVRYGQAAFYVFAQVFPAEAERIVNTDKDPFYKLENLGPFMEYVYQLFQEQ